MRISDWSSDVCSSDLADKVVPDRDAGEQHEEVDPPPRVERIAADQHNVIAQSPTVRRQVVDRQKQRQEQEQEYIRREDHLLCAPYFAFATVSSAGRRITAFFCRMRRSEEHTSELQSLMRISYAVFCLKKKKTQ